MFLSWCSHQLPSLNVENDPNTENFFGMLELPSFWKFRLVIMFANTPEDEKGSE